MAPRTNGRKRKTDVLHQEEPEEASRLEAIAEDNEEAQASSQGQGSVVPLLHGTAQQRSVVVALTTRSSVTVSNGVGPTMPAAALCRTWPDVEGDKGPQASSEWPRKHLCLQGSLLVAASGKWWLTCLLAAALCDNFPR